jgi:hypothetical protein
VGYAFFPYSWPCSAGDLSEGAGSPSNGAKKFVFICLDIIKGVLIEYAP